MQIGILETDRLKPAIVNQFGDYPEMFARLLHIADASLKFKTYAIMDGDFPTDIDECDAFLITGSQVSSYDGLVWITELEDTIRQLAEAEKKLLGICFGHQLIAQALGGRVEKYQGGWGVGIMRHQVLCDKAWMQPIKEHFDLVVSHQDQVMELPPMAERISCSDFCLNAAYQIGEHILCFQGHPEFSPSFARNGIDRRRGLIGETCYQQALSSLQGSTDHILLARWLINFLQH